MSGWAIDFIGSSGYLGILLLMIAENVFPPIPSELIMPLAGFAAGSGRLSLPLVIAVGTLGSVLGALPWYWAGRWLGEARLERFAGRHGRWLTVGPDDVRRAQAWFRQHCGRAVLVGRLLPAVRTLISAPAGVARMALPRFLLFTTLGSLAWVGALAAAGYALGQDYERVGRYLGPVSNGIVALVVVVYVVRVVRWKGPWRESDG